MDEYLPKPVGYRVDPVVSRRIAIAAYLLRGRPMNLSELNAAIIKWADDREITKHSTAYAQAFKTAEEVEELVRAHTTWRIVSDYTATEPEAALAEIKDAIGDIYVTLVVGMACCGTLKRDIDCLANQGASGQKDPVGCLQRNLVALSKFAPQEGDEDPKAMYYAAVGLMIGNLIKVAEDFGTTLEECVNGAYNEIKDRKGRLLPNGIFEKEST